MTSKTHLYQRAYLHYKPSYQLQRQLRCTNMVLKNPFQEPLCVAAQQASVQSRCPAIEIDLAFFSLLLPPTSPISRVRRADQIANLILCSTNPVSYRQHQRVFPNNSNNAPSRPKQRRGRQQRKERQDSSQTTSTVATCRTTSHDESDTKAEADRREANSQKLYIVPRRTCQMRGRSIWGSLLMHIEPEQAHVKTEEPTDESETPDPSILEVDDLGQVLKKIASDALAVMAEEEMKVESP
ncbi:hypothetical protein EV127DRAFT_497929 [Xylaria flabelliformis]|nr:hypothetical protein EV127DRAFT_497929 [Xylaria flabelliformis]